MKRILFSILVIGFIFYGYRLFFVQKSNITNSISLAETVSYSDLKEEVIIEDQETLNNNTDDIITQQNIFNAINKERGKMGLSILKQNKQLMLSASAKNEDMLTNQYFAHDSPIDNKKNFAYFISQYKYNFIRVSENLAMGDFSSTSEVVNAWMNSSNHRSNILFQHYLETGISVKTGLMNGKKVILIVQHFGIPQAACPTVSEAIIQTMHNIEKKADIAKKQADLLKDQVHTAEKQITQGYTLIDVLIDKYNDSIRAYNQLVIEFQAITSEYNRQKNNYDICVGGLN